jgi:hypothetical protein
MNSHPMLIQCFAILIAIGLSLLIIKIGETIYLMADPLINKFAARRVWSCMAKSANAEPTNHAISPQGEITPEPEPGYYSRIILYQRIIDAAKSDDELDALETTVLAAGFQLPDESSLIVEIDRRRQTLSEAETPEENKDDHPTV